jgi:hypothetical protein
MRVIERCDKLKGDTNSKFISLKDHLDKNLNLKDIFT